MSPLPPPVPRLTHREVERLRHARGRSMLLFVTDRCPVGCAHCSVDSRADSPTITDFELFESIVDWIADQPGIEVVGLSGGEPFAERRGLRLAVQRLTAAGKRLVVFTSGVWARAARTPRWIDEVLAGCECVYLSTDAFHARTVEEAHFVRAAQAVAEAGAWIVVQALDHGDTAARVKQLLHEAFGPSWPERAEVNRIVPLTHGRGGVVFTRTVRLPGQDFGPCSLVRSPMVRYDGLVTACCNESVLMSQGPGRLRQTIRTRGELDAAVRGFHADPLLRAIGGPGLGLLTAHPRLSDLASRRFASNCDLCWQVLDRLPDPRQPDRLVQAISTLTPETAT